MSLIKRITSLVLPAALGGGAALMVVTLSESEKEDTSPVMAAKKPSKTAKGRRPARAAGDRAPIRRRRSRAWVEEPADGPAGNEVAEAPAPLPDAALLDPEEARREIFAMWERRLGHHASAAVDRGWASEAESQYKTDLEGLSADRFEVSSIDCRTESCVATVDFDSYDEATAALDALLHHPYAAGCGTGIVMPEPDDPAAAYRANVYFDCEEARS